MEIVLCVTGSVAAIEAVKLARELRRHEIKIKCFMSDDACEIIHPHVMEFATDQKVILELTGKIEHVKYAQADLVIVAPATANVISKFAYKIADNPINTLLITAFGYKTPIIFVPSMHYSMYQAILENINKLERDGINFIKPKIEENKAKFPDINDIVLHALKEISDKSLQDKKILVSAGSTYEAIDPVRGITNRSSGKTGVEIAREAFIRGAKVTMLCGKMDVSVPSIFREVKVESTEEMQGELKNLLKNQDIFISAAAISDFIPEKSIQANVDKISSDNDIILKLKRAPKIINSVKKINPNIFLVGFKAEYNVSDEQLIDSARKKMKESHSDIMIANDVAIKGGGFGSDKNEIIIIDEDVFSVPLTSKREISQRILDRIIEKI